MTKKDSSGIDPAALRRRAEDLLRGKPADLSALPPEEAGRLLHELQVHQIELEMQNDELRGARHELEASRVKYFDLYDLAPVGYFTVSEKGLILEANLRGADLLGVGRSRLVKQPLTRYILPEDQDVYYLHRKQLLATGKAHTCELRMVKADGTVFWVRLTATTQDPSTSAGQGTGGAPTSRVVLSDISEQKQMEQDRAELDARLQRAKPRPRPGPKPPRGKNGKKAAKK